MPAHAWWISSRYVQQVSDQVTHTALAEAVQQERPIRYLESTRIDKEALARTILRERPLEQGLICAFKTVEPFVSFEYHWSANRTYCGIKLRPRKCRHIYQYYLHPILGFLHARLQTWFPFNIQIALNGREWLAREFRRRGYTEFARHDNCFIRVGDPQLAQRLLDRQLTTNWQRMLDSIARQLNPAHAQVFKAWPHHYYWSAYQTEWATDLLFAETSALAAIYPALIRHAMLHFQSPDLMRFLGRKLHGGFLGELTTSFTARTEGVRVKHWANGNSIKMYDKAGRILRVETTIGNTKDFKVLRPCHNSTSSKLQWRPRRKGIADLHRRAQVSQRSNANYLDALAVVDDSTPRHHLLDEVSHPVTHHGRRVRPLRLGDLNDLALLKAICRGEFATSGFRNRDLRKLLYPTAPETARQKLSARLSRLLRMLRAHRLIQKVPKTHRYRLTPRGQLFTTALLAARETSIHKLIGTAAA